MIDDRLGEGDALSVEERDGTTATMMSTRSVGAASRAPCAASPYAAIAFATTHTGPRQLEYGTSVSAFE